MEYGVSIRVKKNIVILFALLVIFFNNIYLKGYSKVYRAMRCLTVLSDYSIQESGDLAQCVDRCFDMDECETFEFSTPDQPCNICVGEEYEYDPMFSIYQYVDAANIN